MQIKINNKQVFFFFVFGIIIIKKQITSRVANIKILALEINTEGFFGITMFIFVWLSLLNIEETLEMS
jgi:hypothetical protein